MPDPLRMTLGETRLVAIDYGPQATEEDAPISGGKLEQGELLTGTPTVTVTPVTVPPLAAASVVVSTAIIVVNGRSVPIGQAVQFKLSGGVTGTEEFSDGKVGRTYHLKVSVGTTSSPAQTFVDEFDLELVDADAS